MRRKILLSIVLSMLLILSPVYTVHGDDTGSITIDYTVEHDNNGSRVAVPVSGASFKVYMVYSSATYPITLKTPFDAIESDPNNPVLARDIATMESEDIQKLSNRFEEYINSATPVVAAATTDGNGKFTINNLEIGAYLFIQEKPVIIDNQYYMANSFLVTVPYRNSEGNMLYSINIKPKGTIIKSPEIVKYVNDTDLYGLKYKEEVFTYSICTFIPSVKVNTITIHDALEEVLEFAPELNLKITIDEGYDAFEINDPIGNGFVVVDETSRTITLTLENSYMSVHRGKAIRIDFDAKIKAGASLNMYPERKVPNKACYIIDNFISNKRDSYEAFMAKRTLNAPLMILGPINLPSTYVFQSCSENVYVYVPEKPIIPVTGILIMETLEKNPWIILAVALVVGAFVKRVNENYNK